MGTEYASIRISKPILDEIKISQHEKWNPIKSNDSLFIAVACKMLMDEGYFVKDQDHFSQKILDVIDVLKKDEAIDPMTRGYEKRKKK